MKFVIFEGNETELEFLIKCIEQYDIAVEEENEIQKMMLIASVFHEMRHRVEEIEMTGGEN